jgi:restriction system protein
MFAIPPHVWEEIVAGAFFLLGFDEVIVTPRSGDLGRDLLVTKLGIGSVKIIVSVKAYRRGALVRYDDVRALMGVLQGERDASKAILITTSDFPPRMKTDPFIGPWLPHRLQLLSGDNLREWLVATRMQVAEIC